MRTCLAGLVHLPALLGTALAASQGDSLGALFPLTVVAGEGGNVRPDSGEYSFGTIVPIDAWPYRYYVFDRWIGEGPGSYSGPDTPVRVTMGGPIRETARFQRISHEISLSLSDTDPTVSGGGPLELGNVHLWLTCSTGGGLTSLVASLTGSMQVAGFAPAPGILNGGDATNLELASASGCISGPTLLGTFVVVDPDGGELCFETTTATPRLTDCSALPGLAYEWPRDLKIAGVRTDGGAPCASGRRCHEAAPSGSGTLPAAAPSEASLGEIRPGPSADVMTIPISMSRPGPMTLEVFDASGRLVREIRAGNSSAGHHEAFWDGRDAKGIRVDAGHYFVRLSVEGAAYMRKVVLAE